MNIIDLFAMQRRLDNEIEINHPIQPREDRVAKKKLALLVEIGELANEVRNWKFWSKDQRQRTDETIYCDCQEGVIHWGEGSTSLCERCDGDGIRGHENLVLNEYVDCIHFLLSIGNEYAKHMPDFFKDYNTSFETGEDDYSNSEYFPGQFNAIFRYASKLGGGHNEEFNEELDIECYYHVFMLFIGLGEMLGFTERQIVDAYMQKNEKNWQRQENGY